MQYFKNIHKDRYVLANFVKQDLANRYRHSFLGMAWTFLSPLGLVLVIGSVYSIIFGVEPIEFIPYLFGGIIPWTYMNGVAEGGAMSYISAQGYVKQTQVSIEIFPIRIALGAFVNLLISIGAFWVIYLFIGASNFNLSMLLTIPAAFIWMIFGIGWATIASIINLYIRDFQPLQSIILQALFYITPIVYQTSMLEDKGFGWVYRVNPFYYLFEIIRTSMLGHATTDLSCWGISLFVALIMLGIGMLLIKKIGRKITFRL